MLFLFNAQFKIPSFSKDFSIEIISYFFVLLNIFHYILIIKFGLNCVKSTILNDACLPGQSCPTLCDLKNCSPPGSSIHGNLQAKILEWFAISYSRASSWSRGQTYVFCVSCIGRWILYHWATWEAPFKWRLCSNIWVCSHENVSFSDMCFVFFVCVCVFFWHQKNTSLCWPKFLGSNATWATLNSSSATHAKTTVPPIKQ